MDQLEKDVLDLQKSMNILASIVDEQQESIDTLEHFIEQSKETINESSNDLHKTNEYKSSTYAYIIGSILVLLYVII